MNLFLKVMLFGILVTKINIGFSWQGIALHGDPKYSESDMQHLDYVNPHAPKGGEIRLGMTGSFDTLNPYSTKGISPLLFSTLVFQSLGQSALDEPFSTYPEIAKSFSIAPDKLSMQVEINEQAKFSDGKGVSYDDIEFSFNLFKSDKVDAFYNSYWADIERIEKISDRTFKFIFKRVNPELPLIALQMSVLPKSLYGSGDFNKDFAHTSLGSGPYLVDDFKRGSFISYKRNPEFWAKDHVFFKGRFNFDKITIKYFKDKTAMIESFKKNGFDFYAVYTAKIWAKDLKGKQFEELGWASREEWQHQNNQGAQIFAFNLRKAKFQNIAVRKAMALAFDFKWTNKTLFFNQYKRNESYFENSPLKAQNMAEGEELNLLKEIQSKFSEDFPQDVLSQPIQAFNSKTKLRDRLKQAVVYLKNAGYKMEKGIMTGPAGKLEFTFLLSSQAMARVVEPYLKNLKKIGIIGKMQVKEISVYQRRLQAKDFDMIVLSIGQSQSPGNEQIDFWHSKSADQEYSRNHIGLKNKAVDSLIEKIIYAKTRQELEVSTRALDRLLYHLHLGVHNWHIKFHRVALWKKFAWPQQFPEFYNPFQRLDQMWVDRALASKLEKAVKSGKPLR